jgi:hypothetical protein
VRPSHVSAYLIGASVAFALLAVRVPQARLAAYAPAQPTRDTLRARSVASHTDRSAGEARVTVVRGYWSSCGLPPVAGQFTFSDTGMMVRSSAEDRNSSSEWRPSTITLAYVDEDGSGIHYLFHVDGGVFETDFPGPLLRLANGARTAEHSGTARLAGRTLVDAADPVALRQKAGEIAQSSYADSLYRLFGRPRAGIGVIGPRGRRAGRLGEYMAARDSLALDPGHMIGEDQLRHALAHELGHRWQARAGRQVAMLWSGVPPIKDPKRYGYDDLSEHQAEAIAFAINFLQTTAPGTRTDAVAITLLEHYELLVPGTRAMVRYFSQQPLYRYHPLRFLLNTASLSRS